MRTFFIGCTHFGHENIIKLANRPFRSVTEMNETMVRNWNETVSDHDVVWHLGDFCHTSSTPAEWMERLNGTIYCLQGNHDPSGTGWPLIIEKKIQGERLVLCHYPIEDWNRRFSGSIHLHAHTHSHQFRNPNLPEKENLREGNKLEGLTCNRFCVGAEAVDYRPVSLSRILREARS